MTDATVGSRELMIRSRQENPPVIIGADDRGHGLETPVAEKIF